MKRNLKLWAIVGLASLPLLLAGCDSKENMYDPAKADALLKAEYSAKFIAKYGEFAADHSWDATSNFPKYQSSRAAGYAPTKGDYYNVEGNTLDWLQEKLKNEQDNSALGKPFAMTVPNNKFTIVPIFQGSANYRWKLHLVVGEGENGQDIEFWSKSQGIQYKYWNWGKWDWADLSGGGNTESVRDVRSRQYTFDLTDYAGQLMYFYLKVEKYVSNWWGGGSWEAVGNMSSLEHQMLALSDCPRPSNIGKENETLILACEDGPLEDTNTDKDYNEVVLLMYGNPEVPKPIEITDKEITEVKTKRYMIEDLGSTDDFDFNDVVVDVTSELTKKLTYTNGKLTGTEVIGETQKAVIRHLGGTVPFQLTIGNTALKEMQGQMDANPDTEFDIAGWEPEKNNISVKVKDANNEIVHDIEFPKDGTAPMIIAVDETVNWMEERVSITSGWWDGLRNK